MLRALSPRIRIRLVHHVKFLGLGFNDNPSHQPSCRFNPAASNGNSSKDDDNSAATGLLSMTAVDYLLQETSVGYGLYQVVLQPETIGNRLKEVQETAQDLARFRKMVKLVSFAPFQ